MVHKNKTTSGGHRAGLWLGAPALAALRALKAVTPLTPLAAVTTLGALAALAAGSGCSRGDQAGAQTQGGAEMSEVPRNVRVMTLEPTTLEEYLVISGPSSPLDGTDLSAEESGHVAAIPRDKGAEVKGGEVLIQLDRRLLKAEMEAAQAERELARYNADRTRELFEANSVSRLEMMDAETQARRAEAAAEAAEIRFDRAAIGAPFDGVVVDRYVELGQLVSPGMPVARIVNPYVLTLEGALTEQEVRRIHEGERATVRFDGVEAPVEGCVHWVAFEADPMTGKFKVEIRIDNPDLRLRPGVIGRARVLKQTYEDVLAIPRDAVLLQAGQPTAFVVENDHAYRRELELGASQGLMVVVEQGLRAGERVVVRGHRELREGSAVLVQQVAESPDGTIAADPEVVSQARALSDENADREDR